MRRKIHKCLSFLLAAVLLASLAAPAALAAEGGDTVFVRTAEDLVQLAENCTLDSWSQGRIVRLEADIDLSGTDFTPIPTFGGTFEGQGHTISGLSITGSGNVRGLFRYIQPSGVVRDLSVEGRVDPSDRKNTLGGIAGSNRGLLAGCTFHGTVRGADSIGGLGGSTRARDRSSTALSPEPSRESIMPGASPGRTTAPLSSAGTAAASTPRRWMRSWIWTPSTGNS